MRFASAQNGRNRQMSVRLRCWRFTALKSPLTFPRGDRQMLEEDAIRFDTFLKENDKKAHEAIKKAERETKVRQRETDTSRLSIVPNTLFPLGLKKAFFNRTLYLVAFPISSTVIITRHTRGQTRRHVLLAASARTVSVDLPQELFASPWRLAILIASEKAPPSVSPCSKT